MRIVLLVAAFSIGAGGCGAGGNGSDAGGSTGKHTSTGEHTSTSEGTPTSGSTSTGGGTATGESASTGGGTSTGDDTSTGGDSTTGGGKLCESLGWCELTDTRIDDVCPNDPEIGGSCVQIVQAWSGGVADEQRNRLIVWGGGHNDYWGNEVYALDLNDLTMKRLNDPSPQNPTPEVCTGTLPDGTPNSRHTYNGLAYVAHADRMSVFSGGPACLPGGFDDDTWTLDLAALTWKAMDPTSGGPPNAGVPAAAYDPVTKKVYVHDTTAFWQYDYDTNAYKALNEWAPIDYHLTAVVDPKRRLFVLFGGGQARAIPLDGPTWEMQNWDATVSGCDAIRDAAYPGLAYDPVQERIVGWAGGDTVHLFDPDTKECTPVTHGGGPGPQPGNGTHGRFRYMPQLGVFALVNGTGQNAYTLRLTMP